MDLPAPPPDDDDDDSTLLRVGKSASTFSQMSGFVHDIESRPLARFLEDLPSLLALPDTKYKLVALVIRKRLGHEDEGQDILVRLRFVAYQTQDPIVRERAGKLIEQRA